MTVTPLVPDLPVAPAGPAAARSDGGGAFARLVDAAGGVFARADAAEHRFAAGRGGMLEMVVERARADVALGIASAAAQRAASALQSVLGMSL